MWELLAHEALFANRWDAERLADRIGHGYLLFSPERVTDHGNAWAFYFRDPEGNPVEMYCATPFYTPQPCGELFDLSKSDEEIYRETEALCRSRPDFEPAEQWRAKLAARIQGRLNEIAA